MLVSLHFQTYGDKENYFFLKVIKYLAYKNQRKYISHERCMLHLLNQRKNCNIIARIVLLSAHEPMKMVDPTHSTIDISPLLFQDDADRVREITAYITSCGIKVRKIQLERLMMSSVLYAINDGKWDIYLYNYTRHRGLAFPYIYLSLASILRREKIWFKTINPISLDKINDRIIIDHYTDKVEIKGAADFRHEFLQGFYLGFEVDFLLKNNKITHEEALKLFYDCDHMPEQAGFCAAIRRNGGYEQAKVIFDHFWKVNDPAYLKTIERIDECIDRNAIHEKDFFYIQKVHYPELKTIDFDTKFDIFMKDSTTTLAYDLAISFAGEDRSIAKEISDLLSARGYKVFYDEYEKSKMWGKNMYEYLSDIYHTKAKYCLILISEHYVKKVWTRLERQAAQSRAFMDDNEYILPLRLDDTVVPGIMPTTAYIDFKDEKVENIINLLVEKINNYGS